MANRNGDAISMSGPALIQTAFGLSAWKSPPAFGPHLQLVPAEPRPDPAAVAAQSIPALFGKGRARSQATVRPVEP